MGETSEARKPYPETHDTHADPTGYLARHTHDHTHIPYPNIKISQTSTRL